MSCSRSLPSLPCPPPEDSSHPHPHQESVTNQHFVLVNMHSVKLPGSHFPVRVSGVQYLPAWLSPLAIPELPTQGETLYLFSNYLTTTQPSNHYSLCLCEFGKLPHISEFTILILLRLVCII